MTIRRAEERDAEWVYPMFVAFYHDVDDETGVERRLITRIDHFIEEWLFAPNAVSMVDDVRHIWCHVVHLTAEDATFGESLCIDPFLPHKPSSDAAARPLAILGVKAIIEAVTVFPVPDDAPVWAQFFDDDAWLRLSRIFGATIEPARKLSVMAAGDFRDTTKLPRGLQRWLQS